MAGLGYGTRLLPEPGDLVAPPGAWDLALDLATEPHFITYVILMAWLVRLVIAQPVAVPGLIRLGSFRRLAAVSCAAAVPPIGVTLATLTAAWLIASAALGLRWSGDPTPGTAAARLSLVGISAPLGLLLQIALIVLSLITIQFLFTTLWVVFRRRAVEILSALALWLWAAAATMGAFPEGSPLNFGYFLNASLSATSAAGALSAAASIAATWVFCALAIGEQDRRARGGGTRFTAPALVFMAGVVGLLVVTINGIDLHDTSLYDTVSVAFTGSAGTLAQFFVSSFIFIGYAYMFGVRLSEVRDGWAQLQLLRHGSITRWCARLALVEFLKAIAFLAVLLGLATLIYLLLGGREFSPPDGGFAVWAYQFMVNGVLQLAVYLGAVFAATWVTPSRAGALVICALLIMLAYLQNTPSPWLPVQLSGMALTVDGWSPVLAATGTLAAALCVLVVSIPPLLHWQKLRS